MVFIIILAIIFFVLAICVVMVACLKMAGKEDEWLMRQMEEKSIENTDVFVHDGEPNGEVISVEEKDGGVEVIAEGKTLHQYVVANEEIQDVFLKNTNFNLNPNDVKIFGVDLAKEKENENGLDNN